MFDQLFFVDIDKSALPDKIQQMHAEGYKLTMMSVNKKDAFELLYSFEKGYEMTTVRVQLQSGDEEVESICKLYPYSYLYENEAKELFGINIVNIDMDFKGHLYKKSMETPFAPKAEGSTNE